MLSGCGVAIPIPHHNYAPTMKILSESENSWRIFAPHKEDLAPGRGKAFLPQYFSGNSLGESRFLIYNYFYALHKLEDDSELALFVNLPSTYRVQTVTFEMRDTVNYYDNSKRCIEGPKIQMFVVSFNNVNVDFDNTSISIINDSLEINAIEIRADGRIPINGKELSQTTYKLNSDNVIKEKQFIGNSLEYSTFFFKAPLSCKDMDGIIFVIDGLYHLGKKLSPLKVRMTYFDPDSVPELRE